MSDICVKFASNPLLESAIRLAEFCAWGCAQGKSMTVPIVYIYHWFPNRTVTGWDEMRWDGHKSFSMGVRAADTRWKSGCADFRWNSAWYWMVDVAAFNRPLKGHEMYFCKECVRAWEWEQERRR